MVWLFYVQITQKVVECDPKKQWPHYYNQALVFDTNIIFKQLWSDSKRLKLECLTAKRQSDDCPYKS